MSTREESSSGARIRPCERSTTNPHSLEPHLTPPPQAPTFNTYTFESAYEHTPTTPAAYPTPPLSPRRFSRRPTGSPGQYPHSHSASSQQPYSPTGGRTQWRPITSESGTPPSLDTSHITLLDESLVTDSEPSLPATPLLRHAQPDIYTHTPGAILHGLGIEGLFEGDAKAMGLLSERFGNGTDEGADEDDTRPPSKTFLREALFTFSNDDCAPPEVDVFSTPESPSTSGIPAVTEPSNAANSGDDTRPSRTLSISTISRRLKTGKAVQKGQRPMWKF